MRTSQSSTFCFIKALKAGNTRVLVGTGVGAYMSFLFPSFPFFSLSFPLFTS